MATVVRRYQRVEPAFLSNLARLLPAGALISKSTPIPGEYEDISLNNLITNYAADCDEIMANAGFVFVAENPVTTLAEAAAAGIPPISSIRESGGTALTLGVVSDGQTLIRSGTTIIGSSGGSSFDMRDIFVFDHFMSSNFDTDEMGLMGWRQYATGTGNNITFSGSAGRPGVLILSGGTAAAARAGISLGETGTGGKVFLGGTGTVNLEWLMKFPAAADFSILNLERMTTGFGVDISADAEITDGLYVRYAPFAPTLDTNWMLVAATASTRTAASSGIAPVANTWVRFKIIYTPGVGAALEINGTQVATVTTNIPTSTGLGVGMIMYSVGSGTNVNGHWDYILGTQVTNKEGV